MESLGRKPLCPAKAYSVRPEDTQQHLLLVPQRSLVEIVPIFRPHQQSREVIKAGDNEASDQAGNVDRERTGADVLNESKADMAGGD